jgi:hypothetical protein
MKNIWIEPAGRKSMPSPGASDERPSKPFMRVSGFVARKQRSQTATPLSVISVATSTPEGS